MNKLIFLLICILALLTACTQTQAPNFIIIQADDLGYDDLGLHGNTIIETPNLDRLGEQSVRFDNFHVSSVCAPTRAALLTGRNFLRTGVSGVHAGRDFINLEETLISEIFQQNGYKTGMWGKWHSGKTNGYFPWDRGFDEAYYSLLYNYFDNTGLLNGEAIQTRGFTTDAITDMALKFIEENKNQPFFAYIPHLAPHNPWRAPDSYINKYLAKGLSEPMATLYGMIDNLDFNIGRVVNKVNELGIADNTIIVFLSDNGPSKKSYRFGLTADEWQQRNPNDRRGSKGKNWENGIISPLFIYFPGQFKSHQVLKFSKVEDLFPTLLDMAGIPVPKHLVLDGQSLLLALKGNTLPSEPVFVAHFSAKGDESFGNVLDKWGNYIPYSTDFRATFKTKNQRLTLLKEPYKYIQNESNGTAEIFNLFDNPKEQDEFKIVNDVLGQEMQKELYDWYDQILKGESFKMPTFQIGYDERKFNQIFAYAPAETSSTIMNMDLYSGNWINKGDYAKFNIKVLTPGEYEIILVHKISTFENLTIKASTKSAKTSSPLIDSGNRDFGTLLEGESAYWENFDLIETFKKDIIKSKLGQLQLHSDDTLLTIEIEELANSHKGKITDQLIAIQLIKTK